MLLRCNRISTLLTRGVVCVNFVKKECTNAFVNGQADMLMGSHLV